MHEKPDIGFSIQIGDPGLILGTGAGAQVRQKPELEYQLFGILKWGPQCLPREGGRRTCALSRSVPHYGC